MFISKRTHGFRLTPTQKRKYLLYGLMGMVGFLVVGFIFAFILFAWFARDLPSPGKLSETEGSSTVYYDRNGKVIYEMYKDKNRIPVPLKDISTFVKEGTIAIEDKNFYTHGGVSQSGLVRAFINIFLKRRFEGGSTITQQLIKNVLLYPSRTPSRKIKEMILAFDVERRYTKDEILEMYLNESPYGGNYYGVMSASRGYFGKDPKDLNLAESAILSGLPQNPSVYSPHIGVKDAWKGRTMDVLRRMREDGYISRDQEKKALADLDKVKFTPPHLDIDAPHFVFYVRDQIEKEFGSKLIDQGVKVKTTLDLDVQRAAQKAVHDEILDLKEYKVGNGAAVVLDSKTGDILAMVGSYDYGDEKFGKFNVATALRQPGSTIKPVTYALAFEKGYTPATVVMDVKTEFASQGDEAYSPVNYDGKFRGPTQLRFALGNSYNIPAVKLLAMVGLRDFLQKASDMGLTTFAPTDENMKRFGLAVTLGGGESTLLDMTSAFSVFAAGGVRRDPSSILEITDFDGKKIYKKSEPKSNQVISKEAAFLISHIMSDNNARVDAFGPNSFLRVPGKTVAVKTGTTNDKRDNWTIGYTNDITVGVWVGNNDNSPMNQNISSGVTGASPIWHNIMVELLKKYKDGIMEKPDKVKALEIDALLGGLPRDGQSKRTEYFIEGTEPKETSPYYKKLKISKTNGKLANDIEVRTGNYDEKDYIVITESDPVSTDGRNRWQEGINEWAKNQGDDRFKGPTEVSDNNSDNVVVQIKSPGNQSTVGNPVNLSVKITSSSSIKNVKVYLNGSEYKNFDGDNKDINENFSLPDGTYELKVVAKNDKDKTGETTIKIGVNKPWDAAPTSTSTPSPTP